MNVSIGVEPASCLNECVDKLVVSFASYSFLPQTKIQLIVEKLLVVSTAVKADRQCAIGVDTSAQRGEDEFGHRDEDTADSLVAYA